MRAYLAYGIVRFTSHLIEQAYEANCKQENRREWFFIEVSHVVMRVGFPIAAWADKDMMVSQMIEESWWG